MELGKTKNIPVVSLQQRSREVMRRTVVDEHNVEGLRVVRLETFDDKEDTTPIHLSEKQGVSQTVLLEGYLICSAHVTNTEACHIEQNYGGDIY